MARKKREYPDDDGRTIVDMSGVQRPNLLIPKLPREPDPPKPMEVQEGEEPVITKEERRMYIFGALKAGLLIALAYIVGIGLIILLMVLLWGRF